MVPCGTLPAWLRSVRCARGKESSPHASRLRSRAGCSWAVARDSREPLERPGYRSSASASGEAWLSFLSQCLPPSRAHPLPSPCWSRPSAAPSADASPAWLRKLSQPGSARQPQPLNPSLLGSVAWGSFTSSVRAGSLRYGLVWAGARCVRLRRGRRMPTLSLRFLVFLGLASEPFPLQPTRVSTCQLPLVDGFEMRPPARCPQPARAATPALAPLAGSGHASLPAACARRETGGARTRQHSAQPLPRRPLPLRRCQKHPRAAKVGSAGHITHGPTRVLEARSRPGVKWGPFDARSLPHLTPRPARARS